MAISVSPVAGVKLDEVYPAATYPFGPHRVGEQVWGDDGKLYVFAKASGAITGGTAVCTVNPSTFAASATGGSYTSPATTLALNDLAWFSKASV